MSFQPGGLALTISLIFLVPDLEGHVTDASLATSMCAAFLGHMKHTVDVELFSSTFLLQLHPDFF